MSDSNRRSTAHICADARMIHNSGIGVYIRHYLGYLLSSTPYRITLLGRPAELSKHFAQFTNWQCVEADFPIYSVQEQLRLPVLVPKCAVFWSPHYNVPLLPVRARRRLVTIPDVFHLAHLDTLSRLQQAYARVVTNAAVRLSDRVTTISKFSAAEIIRLTGVSPAKIRSITLGLDQALFRPVGDELVRESVRIKYQLPNQYVLFVGNVKPNKNLWRLVEGFARLAAQLPHCYLLIAGKKDGFITGDSTLSKRIEADPVLARRVRFSGYVELADLPVLYSMAAAFAFPSLYEGFGFPPLEAMACGCPVVTSDRGSISEVCGQAACYVNPLEPDDIARGLREVIFNQTLRKQLITAGLAHVKQYNWDESQREFGQEIENLL